MRNLWVKWSDHSPFLLSLVTNKQQLLLSLWNLPWHLKWICMQLIINHAKPWCPHVIFHSHTCETTGGLLEELHPIMEHTFLRAALLFIHASGRKFKICAFSLQPGPEISSDGAYLRRFLQCSWNNHCWGRPSWPWHGASTGPPTS